MDYASVGSVLVAIVALIVSIVSSMKKNTKEDTSQVTMMMAKLDSIQDDIRDLKKEVSDMRASIQDNHDRVIKLEMSLETAWKRIDELRGTKDRGM